MGRFGLAIVTIGALFVTPAFADIVTVCAMPSRAAVPASMTTDDGFAQGAAGFSTRLGTKIALAHDEQGYDVILNWHEADEKSLRADGADIFAMELGAKIVHLMVGRDEESLEHFLFSVDSDGAGSLLWSAEPTPRTTAASTRSACTQPD